MMLHCYSINISGKVQGVGFRYNTLRKAKELRLCGFVRNNYDGSVGIEVEGANEMLKLFIDWCRKGPEYAVVKSINITETNLKAYPEFEIR